MLEWLLLAATAIAIALWNISALPSHVRQLVAGTAVLLVAGLIVDFPGLRPASGIRVASIPTLFFLAWLCIHPERELARTFRVYSGLTVSMIAASLWWLWWSAPDCVFAVDRL